MRSGLWANALPFAAESCLSAHGILTATGRRAAGGRALAEARQAAGLPAVRLCRHRQDDAGALFRRACRRPGAVRRLHRQGSAGAALQGRDQCPHHPFADLPAQGRGIGRGRGDRQDLDVADLLAQPAEPDRAGQAGRHRRMLDGRRATRPRPAELRHADPGAGRSRPVAADFGRRLLHRARAGFPADRNPPAGARQSDHPAGARRARGPRVHARRLWHGAGDRQGRRHPGTGAEGRPGAGRHQPHAPALQPAPARAEGFHGRLSAGRRQAGVPAQRSRPRACSTARCGR